MDEQFLDLGFVDQSFLEGFEDTIQRPEQENQQTTTEEENNNNESSEETKQLEESNKETKEVKEPESNKEVEENPEVNQEQGSPNNISSSIAEALVDEGVLQTLDTERLSKIKTTEDLIEAFREDLQNQLSEEQKRISNALTYGVEPSRIQQYEQWIKTLDEVKDEILEGEEEQNENYRKNLIYRDYLNKGFEEADALEMVNRSVESGKDVDDAKKALSSLKKYYQKAYKDEVDAAKKEYEKHVAEQKKQYENLKTSILEDKENFYEQFEVGKSMRQKIFDTVSKPSVVIGKDEDGKEIKITQLQKFIKDDPNKANKIIGTLFVLTDGFTKFDGIMKGTVKKQVRKSVDNLTKALRNTEVVDASLNLKSGIGEETEDYKILDFAI